MKLLPLFLLAVTSIIQVHADIKGARIPGDYQLFSSSSMTSGGTIDLSYQYPATATTRPEVITSIEFIVAGQPGYIVNNILGGVKTTGIKVTLTTAVSMSVTMTIYGKVPIETAALGYLRKDDALLHMETIAKSAKPNKIIVINLKYPKVGSAISTATLNWISVLDRKYNDTASVEVVRGGAGFKSVQLRLISRIGEGLSFKVQIYGKKLTTANWPWHLSYNDVTEALVYKSYWPWNHVVDEPKVRTTCGCRTNRMLTAFP